MKRLANIKVLFLSLCFVWMQSGMAQTASVLSPNQKIRVELHQKTDNGTWFLRLHYLDAATTTVAIPEIRLGLERDDQSFSKSLKLFKTSKLTSVKDAYVALHGKRSQCQNAATEVVFTFENPDKLRLNVAVRAYNDGLAFRYAFPETTGKHVMLDELTSYTIPEGTKRWLEKWNPANEGLYSSMTDGKVQQEWCYPALFQSANSNCWYLIHESDVDRAYCGTKLSNAVDGNVYKTTFPNPRDGNGMGASQPTITLPWKSPWRTVILGKLSDVVESTLTDDVATPSVLSNTKWIKPGVASWNYWSSNHGTKDFQIVCRFADLAASMGWPYTLLDWEWDAMSNGGNLEDAVKYIHSKGVKPLIWYNSGGQHTSVSSTPRDRMLTHESRMEEFAKLKKLGIVGVKVDFFESEKQDMIAYYLDILEDAAKFEIMVYFHGCLVPRGWARTYPNLMTYEGIRGAEWYNNGPDFTQAAPEHNTIVPFTRNVVGSMDYTPVTFTNSQFPHITSFGHELALSVVFESGIQHMADRPDGYESLPDEAKSFLKGVPNAWDNTLLLDGYPGKDIVMARQKGQAWYLGGLNSERFEKRKTLRFDFLPENKQFRLVLIADGQHDRLFQTSYLVVDKHSKVDVKMLRRGGFAAVIKELE
jgi:alpha-glucosidase